MNLYHKNILQIQLVSLMLLVFGCTSKTNKADQHNKGITYSIAFESETVKVAKVTMDFILEDSILYMSNGANNLEKRWATFVHNIKAINHKGEFIKLEEMEDAKWKIHAPLNEKIRLTYNVHLDHENYNWSAGIDGVAYSTDKGVFYTGRTLFIMNGTQEQHIHVEFKLPQNWSVTTPWTKFADNPNTYQVKNNTELTNSMFFAGTHKEFSIKRDDFELIFALGSTAIINDEIIFNSLALGVLDYYIDLMGGLPKPSPDEPFKKIVVVISSNSSTTDGEVIGNSISIIIKKDADQFSKTISRFIFAHEFFHLWNGKSFRPASENTEWFKEGFTNYYTLKALHHVGFLTDESYLDFLGSFFYKQYNDDDGVGILSMANGEEKHEHWGLVYAGGMLVGIAQDMIIRNATQNAKSIDDVMRSLFIKYGHGNTNYTFEELKSMMSELSGMEQTEFFNTYVLGKDKIPIDKYLTWAGLNAEIVNGELILTKKAQPNQEQQHIMEGLFGKIHTKQ